MDPDFPEFLYRFRSLNNLLDRGELEKQEIYFAELSRLNDPVEGYLDLTWQGDAIVWTNFFRHYLLCLERFYLLLRLGKPLTDEDIYVFLTDSKFPTPLYKEKFEKIWDSFVEITVLGELPKYLGELKRKIRRDEVIFLLRSLHPSTLRAIVKAEGGELQPTPNEQGYVGNLLRLYSGETSEVPSVDVGYTVAKLVMDQLDLRISCDNEDFLKDKNRRYLLSEFPQKYVEQLEKLIYPPCFISCFMEKVDNAALWAHYGDSHEGVCLKFKPNPHMGLNLRCIVSYGASRGVAEIRKGWGDKLFPLHKVKYDEKYPEVDFFRSLGRASVGDLRNFWYSSSNGEISSCAKDVFENEMSWRDAYWSRFNEINTIKLKEWEYEGEYRLLLSSGIGDLTMKEDRLLKYNFSDLAGIIFGIRTPMEKRVEIIKLVEKKCKELKVYGIKFYQASYSSQDGKMATQELPSLQPKEN